MRLSPLDFLLLLMVVIWGSNFSVIKYALREFPETSFNALRLLLASAVFLVAIAFQARRARLASPPPSPDVGRAGLRPTSPPSPDVRHAGFQRTSPPSPAPALPEAHLVAHRPTSLPLPSHLSLSDWRRVFFLGLVGTCLYQLFFLAGVARTSVANSALLFGCTPVMVAIMASIAGHERLTTLRWTGAGLSLAGIYAVVGRGAAWSTSTLLGDALVVAAMLCWSLYSVVAQPLLTRHSPLVITGWSMVIGTALYLPIAIGPMMVTDWAAISATSWVLMVASSLLALAFAYIVWYTAVQRIGSSRTAIYSNLTPIVAMAVGAVWLGERISGAQLLGTALILSGVAVTRLQRTPETGRGSTPQIGQ